jgi:hypothetical protein
VPFVTTYPYLHIWHINTQSGSNFFETKIKLLKPVSCLRSIGKISKNEVALIGGLSEGHNLVMIKLGISD